MTKTKNDKEDILEKDPAKNRRLTPKASPGHRMSRQRKKKPKRERKHPAAKRLHRKRLKSR